MTHPALEGIDPETVIDKSSPIPLHHQLERFLRSAIENGLFAPYQTLPTEQELQEFFRLSRTPIRQALAKLTADGLIDRRRSQGTIVLPKPFEESLRSLTTFTQEVRKKGWIPGCRLLEFEVIPADPEDRKHLQLQPDERVYHVRRLRFVNNEPVGIWTSHIPLRLVPHLSAGDFGQAVTGIETGPQQSMYYVLEQVHGITLVRASETFRAVSLDPDFARLLNMPAYSAVLLRSRVTFDRLGRAVAFEQGLYRGVYRLEWHGREVSSIDTTGLEESGDGTDQRPAPVLPL